MLVSVYFLQSSVPRIPVLNYPRIQLRNPHPVNDEKECLLLIQMLSFSSRGRAYIPPIIISCGHRFLAVWLTAALLSSESSHHSGETHVFICNFFGRIIPPRVDIATPRLILCPDNKFIFFISFYKIDLEIKVLILQKKNCIRNPRVSH